MVDVIEKIIPTLGIAAGKFCCRYDLEDEILFESIKKHGILSPLVVVKCAGENTLLSGHKRFRIASALKFKNIPVLELKREAGEKELFLAAILLNWRALDSDLDIAWTLYRAKTSFQLSDDIILQDVLPALGLKSEKNALEESLDVLSLDSSVLDSIALGNLPFRGARKLASWNSAEQALFNREVISKIKLTSSQLLQIADWIPELTKRDQVSLRNFLGQSEFQTLLNSSNVDRRTKADEFFNLVQNVRFPQLGAQRKRFDLRVQELKVEFPNIEIQAPRHFEDVGYFLKAHLKSPESLERVLDSLKRNENALNSLFDIML